MWIRGRFSDISKRRESIRRLGLIGVACLLGLGVYGCVVTDKIEFEDAVNHPVSIERNQPTETVVSVSSTERREYSAVVWDQDITDPQQSRLEGRVEIRADYWRETVNRECSPPSLVSETPDTDASDQGLPRFLVGCTVDLSDFEVLEGSLVEVRLMVSDRGFFGSVPRDGARTAEMHWVLDVREEEP